MYSRYQSNYGSRRRSPYTSGSDSVTGSQYADRKSTRLPKNYGGTAINNRVEPEIKADSDIKNRDELDFKKSGDNAEKYPVLETSEYTEPDPEFTFPRWDLSSDASSRLKFKNRAGHSENSIVTEENSYPGENVTDTDISEAVNRIQNTFRDDKTDISGPENVTEIRNSGQNEDAEQRSRPDSDTGGVFNEIKELFKNINLTSSELLLIALIIYLFASHSDDEMVILLLILLILGF